MALFSFEAEYVAKSLLRELKIEDRKPVKLNVDNKSSINLAKLHRKEQAY